jgi:hypothetical protein
MEHLKNVKAILKNKRKSIELSKLVSESYELLVSELDMRLLPSNEKLVLSDNKVRVYYYAYEDLIVYVITEIKTDVPLITGLLFENKLQAYIIE